MNYIQLLQDSWRLFRTTRLVWVFGFLFLLPLIPLPQFLFARDNPVLTCVYFPVAIVSLCIAIVAEGSLYFTIHQASSNQNITFSQAWSQGKLKLLRNFGLFVLSLPFLLVGALSIALMTARMPTSPLVWPIFLLEILIAVGFYTFGFCAIMIHDVKVLAAAWTSFLITINNFSRVFVISGTTYLIRLSITALVALILVSGVFGVELPIPLSLDYPTYQKVATTPIVAWINWFFNLFLFPLESIMLTFVYLQATKDVSYPALVQRQTTA